MLGTFCCGARGAPAVVPNACVTPAYFRARGESHNEDFSDGTNAPGEDHSSSAPRLSSSVHETRQPDVVLKKHHQSQRGSGPSFLFSPPASAPTNGGPASDEQKSSGGFFSSIFSRVVPSSNEKDQPTIPLLVTPAPPVGDPTFGPSISQKKLEAPEIIPQVQKILNNFERHPIRLQHTAAADFSGLPAVRPPRPCQYPRSPVRGVVERPKDVLLRGGSEGWVMHPDGRRDPSPLRSPVLEHGRSLLKQPLVLGEPVEVMERNFTRYCLSSHVHAIIVTPHHLTLSQTTVIQLPALRNMYGVPFGSAVKS